MIWTVKKIYILSKRKIGVMQTEGPVQARALECKVHAIFGLQCIYLNKYILLQQEFLEWECQK